MISALKSLVKEYDEEEDRLKELADSDVAEREAKRAAGNVHLDEVVLKVRRANAMLDTLEDMAHGTSKLDGEPLNKRYEL